ncbi:DUF4124 domain-containing protein [Stutzerimonas chloritidismutans]|uniref:DUF4124 domain-containing protein n=1 Tax=Stutzerimonas chloritidismutans TaxID=203192 RepID=UPI003F14EB62
MHRLLILFAGLSFSSLSSAEIYRWVDPQGNVHFESRPRPGAEQVEVRPQVIERDDATREREARTERFFDARREEQAAAERQAGEQQRKRRQACDRLRHELAQLSHGGRYFRLDAKGERVYYSEDEVGAARRQLASRISQNCG